MRVIFGVKDRPCGSYILIARGIDSEALEYFEHHKKTYPTWGFILVTELGEDMPLLTLEQTAIHRIIRSGSDDESVIKTIKRLFPPYSEDCDPIIDSPCGGRVFDGVFGRDSPPLREESTKVSFSPIDCSAYTPQFFSVVKSVPRHEIEHYRSFSDEKEFYEKIREDLKKDLLYSLITSSDSKDFIKIELVDMDSVVTFRCSICLVPISREPESHRVYPASKEIHLSVDAIKPE